jgi:hypothetical protein
MAHSRLRRLPALLVMSAAAPTISAAPALASEGPAGPPPPGGAPPGKSRFAGIPDAGGGTRTPDTRIMIPLGFGSTAGFGGAGGP